MDILDWIKCSGLARLLGESEMAAKKIGKRKRFPLEGEDEQLWRNAEREAREGLQRKSFAVAEVLPKSIVTAVFTAVSSRTRAKYFRAFIEKKVAEKLPSPPDYVPGNPAKQEPAPYDPYDPFLARPLCLDPDEYEHVDERWDTEWEKLMTKSDEISWKEIPNNEINAFRLDKIHREQWQDWATEFLVFATELRRLIGSDHSTKMHEQRYGGRASHEPTE